MSAQHQGGNYLSIRPIYGKEPDQKKNLRSISSTAGRILNCGTRRTTGNFLFFCKIEWSLAYLIDLIRSLFPFWSPEEEAPGEEPQVALKVLALASSIITKDEPKLIFRGLLPGRTKEKCIEREKISRPLSPPFPSQHDLD